MSLSFLTPFGALVGLVGALSIVALVRGHRRSSRVAMTLGLSPAGRRRLVLDGGLLGAVAALVALAAAQPVIARSETTRGRAGVEVLVVVDVTRSMLARRALSEPTRLDRARTIAKTLRTAVPDTRMGIASLTDRVLPHLFPTLGANAFAAVVDRAIDVERPPPERRSRRATAFSALGDLGRVAFFTRETRHRIAVVLSDGETLPVDLEALRERLANGRVSMVFVQIWRQDESVFDENGVRDPAYQPDRTGGQLLRGVAGAVDAPVFVEGDDRSLAEAVRARLGDGALVAQGRQLASRELAPHALLASIVPLAFVLYRRNLAVR